MMMWMYLVDPKDHNDDVDVLGRPQGSYPESFVPLSLFLTEI